MSTAHTLLEVVAKAVSTRKVVDTGIFMRVKMSRNRGAETCRNLNAVGASEKPFDDRRPWVTSPPLNTQL